MQALSTASPRQSDSTKDHVIPANAGNHAGSEMDPRFRGDDGSIACSAICFDSLDAACRDALKREADAWPKPGLVTPVDSGSHRDMNYASFVDSIASLKGYFAEVAEAGALGATYAEIQPIAIAAEARMLAATRGANTHRGAIFNLGLLVAAAAWRAVRPEFAERSCGAVVAQVWGPAILASRCRAPASHGNAVWRRYAVGGAREEAAAGFPAVYETGLPALRRLLAAGVGEEEALVGTLMALMAELHDTNLLWRGGEAGLRDVQAAAAAFNRAGGVRQAGWREALLEIHAWMVVRNLSPGGSADLVAATWLAHRLEAG
jgi:triphosphoribosyl-dephospho-CoA synthase